METLFADWSHERLQGEWDRDDKSDLAWTVALAEELHGPGFPVWYPDGRPVSFIEDDWYDDFPLVWTVRALSLRLRLNASTPQPGAQSGSGSGIAPAVPASSNASTAGAEAC